MNKLIKGDEKPAPEVLEQMRERGGTWAAYQNHDMGHRELGHLQFLKVGPGCTYETAPKRMPDSHLGFGWQYVHVGFVNLETGEIVDENT